MTQEVILLCIIILALLATIIASFYWLNNLIGILIVIASCGWILEEFAKPLFDKIVDSNEEREE
jgi:hypothetical protein